MHAGHVVRMSAPFKPPSPVKKDMFIMCPSVYVCVSLHLCEQQCKTHCHGPIYHLAFSAFTQTACHGNRGSWAHRDHVCEQELDKSKDRGLLVSLITTLCRAAIVDNSWTLHLITHCFSLIFMSEMPFWQVLNSEVSSNCGKQTHIYFMYCIYFILDNPFDKIIILSVLQMKSGAQKTD